MTTYLPPSIWNPLAGFLTVVIVVAVVILVGLFLVRPTVLALKAGKRKVLRDLEQDEASRALRAADERNRLASSGYGGASLKGVERLPRGRK